MRHGAPTRTVHYEPGEWAQTDVRGPAFRSEAPPSDFSAQLKHYKRQVDAMAGTVTDLRDQLEMERGARTLREQEQLLGHYRRELAGSALEQRAARFEDDKNERRKEREKTE